MIVELIKLAFLMDDQKEVDTVSKLVGDESFDIHVQIDNFVKSNFSNMIYEFYKDFSMMKRDAAFFALGLSRAAFQKEIQSMSTDGVQNVLSNAKEIKNFLDVIESKNVDSLQKTASDTILSMIIKKLSKKVPAYEKEFLKYSEDIRNEVEEIIKTCTFVLGRDSETEIGYHKEIMRDVGMFNTTDVENLPIKSSEEYKQLKENFNIILKSNLAKMINDYVNNNFGMEEIKKGLVNSFNNDEIIEYLGGLFKEDIDDALNSYNFFMLSLMKNKITNQKDQYSLRKKIDEISFKISKLMVKNIIKDISQDVESYDTKSAAYELLRNLKIMVSTANRSMALGVYHGVRYGNYPIENVISLNLNSLLEADQDFGFDFIKQLKATLFHEFDHYLDFGIIKKYIYDNMEMIKNKMSDQIIMYSKDKSKFARDIEEDENFLSDMVSENPKFKGVEKNLKMFSYRHSSLNHKKISDIAENMDTVLSMIKGYFPDINEAVRSAIYLNQEKPNESEILVRINSIKRHIRDTSTTKDHLSNFIRIFDLSEMDKVKYLELPNDATQLFKIILIASKINRPEAINLVSDLMGLL